VFYLVDLLDFSQMIQMEIIAACDRKLLLNDYSINSVVATFKSLILVWLHPKRPCRFLSKRMSAN